jgi:hypothetical protein
MKIKLFAAALGGIALLLAFAALSRDQSVDAQNVPAVVKARAFELVDGNGRPRAQLAVESSGTVVLRLRDEKGTLRVKLGADQDGSGLLLTNEKTEVGVHALATRTRTRVIVQRGARRRALVP